MTMAINSTSATSPIIPVNSTAKGAAVARTDSDGDQDGSKAGEVEKSVSAPLSPTVGNNVNTTA